MNLNDASNFVLLKIVCLFNILNFPITFYMHYVNLFLKNLLGF